MKLIFSSLLFSMVVLLSWGAEAKDWNKAFDKGEILIYPQKVKGFDEPAFIVKAVIEAPPEKVWKLIANCGDYERTMQRIAKADMLPMKNGKVMCRVVVDMPFPYSDLTALTAAVHIQGPPRWSRRWKLVKGDFDYNSGSWVLTRWRGDPKRTLITYRVFAKPKAWIPGWLRRSAQKRTLPNLIKHLRKLSCK